MREMPLIKKKNGRPFAGDGFGGDGGSASVPIATTSTAGIVKPDGTTVTVTNDGTISASGSGFDLSNTPIKVGTYLGKDLYAKVYADNNVTINTQVGNEYVQPIDASFAQSKDLIGVIASYWATSGAQIPLPSVETNASIYCRVVSARGFELCSKYSTEGYPLSYNIIVLYVEKGE